MYSLVITYLRLLFSVFIQKKYIRNHFKPELDKILKAFPIPERHYKKLLNYYSFGVPAMLGYLFSITSGLRMNPKNRYILTNVGALTGVVDDAFDENIIDIERVSEFMLHPNHFLPRTNYEHLMRFLGLNVLNSLNETQKEQFMEYCKIVFELQEKSKNQKNTEISIQELKFITKQKGGVPFEMYRCLVDSNPTAEELKLYYEIGALMQLGNDIFDVYKDTEDGIATLPNTNTSLFETELLLNEWLETVLVQLQKIQLENNRDKRKFINTLLLGMSRCYVCLDQFKSLDQSNIFKVQKYTRAQLICDMEKVSNLFKSMKYFVILKKRYVQYY
ncbi:MAG: class 1 isoprenoid biosynthesis enzyme [Cytophagales bacterium]